MRALALLVPVVLLASCDIGNRSGNRREVGRLGYVGRPAAKLAAVSARVTNGSVKLSASADDKVHLEVAVWLRADRPDTDFMADLAAHVAVTEKDGTFIVTDAHAGAADSDDWELRVALQVPAGLDLAAQASNGQVEVAVPQANDVRAEVANGAIAVKVRDLAGVCRAKVSNGQVDIAIADQGPAGGLDAEVGTGAVSVTLPGSARGSFELDVATGGIDVDARYGLKVEQKITSASVRGVCGTGGPPFRVRVGIGQIRVE